MATSIVLTTAVEDVQVVRIGNVASIGVTVAHATASDTDVFDRVVILKISFIAMRHHKIISNVN